MKEGNKDNKKMRKGVKKRREDDGANNEFFSRMFISRKILVIKKKF